MVFYINIRKKALWEPGAPKAVWFCKVTVRRCDKNRAQLPEVKAGHHVGGFFLRPECWLEGSQVS